MVVSEIISTLLQMDTLTLIIVLLILVIIAFKIIKFLMSVFIAGLIFAFLPVIANLIGLPIDVSFSNMLISAVFGVVAYIVYSTLKGGMKLLNLIFAPLGRLFGSGKAKDKKKDKKD